MEDYETMESAPRSSKSKIQIKCHCHFSNTDSVFYSFIYFICLFFFELKHKAGLCHSAYSNSYVNLKVFNADDEEERDRVKLAMGEDAESMVLLWCTINRRLEVIDKLLPLDPLSLTKKLTKGISVKHLNTNETLTLSPQQVGELLAFEMADACDQQFGWQVYSS